MDYMKHPQLGSRSFEKEDVRIHDDASKTRHQFVSGASQKRLLY